MSLSELWLFLGLDRLSINCYTANLSMDNSKISQLLSIVIRALIAEQSFKEKATTLEASHWVQSAGKRPALCGATFPKVT